MHSLAQLRKLLREYRERFRYRIDRIFAREFTGQLMLFAVLVLVATAIGMTSIFFGLFSDENAHIQGIPRQIDQGFWDSMWWSLHQVLRLPDFERMYGATPAIVAYAFILSIMGLAVFGVLLSLINNTMRNRIEDLRKGGTPVRERGHVLVLGWNNKLVSILQQLASRKPGIRVVILAPREIDKMQEELRVAGIPRLPVTVILRSGIPSNREELDRVAIRRTSSVIVLSTDADDSAAIKTIVLLASREDWAGEFPSLTSEIALEQNYELARIASRDRVHVVSSSRVISKVIVQTIRNPGLSDVYSELFSPGGNSIFVQSIPECTGRMLSEVACNFGDSIPLGIAWDEVRDGTVRHAAGLNPEPDYDFAADEKIVVLSRHTPVSYVAPGDTYESAIIQDGSTNTRMPQRMLIIGWTDILFDILMELDAHAVRGTEVSILSETEAEEAKQKVDASVGRTLKNLSLSYIEGDAIDREVYAELDLPAFQSIVVLADSSGKCDIDTRTLRILLRLSDLRKKDSTRAHTVVELTDEMNRDLFRGLDVDDMVISPGIVSAQLAQIARQKILGPIYHELLSAGGVEISLRPAGDYVETDTNCLFADLVYAAQQKLEIALGLRIDEDKDVLLNPPRDRTWRLTNKDKVIVLAQQLYR